MRYLGGTLDPAASWRRIAEHAGHWALRGFGKWAVERRDTGEWITARRPLESPDWPGVEVGWTLVRGAWGKGIRVRKRPPRPSRGMGEPRV